MLPVEELPRVPERDPRRAAVFADRPVRLDDDRVVGQALLDRRQAAIVQIGALGKAGEADFAGRLRRFVPLLRPGRLAVDRWRIVGTVGGRGERQDAREPGDGSARKPAADHPVDSCDGEPRDRTIMALAPLPLALDSGGCHKGASSGLLRVPPHSLGAKSWDPSRVSVLAWRMFVQKDATSPESAFQASLPDC